METSSSTIASFFLRNLLTSIFVYADRTLLFLHKYKILKHVRYFLVSSFLFFLSLLPSFISFLQSHNYPFNYSPPSSDDHSYVSSAASKVGGSGVSRALSQLLLLMNDIPVSSRKYEVVRSLAEKLIDENLLERSRILREINCAVLSVSFARSLSQLEAAMAEQGRGSDGDGVAAGADVEIETKGRRRHSLLKGIKYCGLAAWRYAKTWSEVESRSAEKLAAELLWLAEKMAASGCAEEAVYKWASAANLAWLALSTEPRLQGSLVNVAAFLIRQAKEMDKDEDEDEVEEEGGSIEKQRHIRETRMKLLMSWLPLLCRANNGTNAPVLSMAERAELERILEDLIETLDEEEEQEMVLSLWLHHFTYCPASDWPNLRACYTRWCSASRSRLLLDRHAQLAT